MFYCWRLTSPAASNPQKQFNYTDPFNRNISTSIRICTIIYASGGVGGGGAGGVGVGIRDVDVDDVDVDVEVDVVVAFMNKPFAVSVRSILQ